MLNFIPRPSQEQILRYRGGRLGIAAVPGAGKTQILSALAAQIIASGSLGSDQEVLIVTLVNSAVDNFESRIKRFFDNPLQALYRYRVRTLHGLAHDIVREKPGRVGLDERFAIIDEREADFIRREAVKAWLSVHAESLDDYLDPGMEPHKMDWVRRDQLPEMLTSLALAFIRSAKDRRLTPEKLRALLDRQPAELPLAELGLEIYFDYQRALTYRAAVDFVERAKVTWSFTQKSLVRVIGQYVSTRRDPSLYLFPVAARSGSFLGSLLYSYKINWQTLLFVGYGDDRVLTERADLLRTGRTLFVKLSYAYQR